MSHGLLILYELSELEAIVYQKCKFAVEGSKKIRMPTRKWLAREIPPKFALVGWLFFVTLVYYTLFWSGSRTGGVINEPSFTKMCIVSGLRNCKFSRKNFCSQSNNFRSGMNRIFCPLNFVFLLNVAFLLIHQIDILAESWKQTNFSWIA